MKKLLITALLLISVLIPNKVNAAEISTFEVQPIIIVPQDQQTRPEYQTVINEANLRAQQWYASKLDGSTFKLKPLKVISMTAIKGKTREEINNAVFLLLNSQGTQQNTVYQSWIVGSPYVPSATLPDESNKGYAYLTSWLLDVYTGQFPNGPAGTSCADYLGFKGCSSRDPIDGSLVHELGHTFGLLHATGPDGFKSPMGDHTRFPNLELLDTEENPEKSILKNKRPPKKVSDEKVDAYNTSVKIQRIETSSNGTFIYGSGFIPSVESENKYLKVLRTTKVILPNHVYIETIPVKFIKADNTYIELEQSNLNIASDIQYQIVTNFGVSNIFVTKGSQITKPQNLTYQLKGNVGCQIGSAIGSTVNLVRVIGGTETPVSSAMVDKDSRWQLTGEFDPYNSSQDSPRYKLNVQFPGAQQPTHLLSSTEQSFYMTEQGFRGGNFDPTNLTSNLSSCATIPQEPIIEVLQVLEGVKQQIIDRDSLGYPDLKNNVITLRILDPLTKECLIKPGNLFYTFNNDITHDARQTITSCESNLVLPYSQNSGLNPSKTIINLNINFTGDQRYKSLTKQLGFSVSKPKDSASAAAITPVPLSGAGLAEESIQSVTPLANNLSRGDAYVGEEIFIDPNIKDANGVCIQGLDSSKITVKQRDSIYLPFVQQTFQNCTQNKVKLEKSGAYGLLFSYTKSSGISASGELSLNVRRLPLKIVTLINGSSSSTLESSNTQIQAKIEARIDGQDECIRNLATLYQTVKWINHETGESQVYSGSKKVCEDFIITPPSKSGSWKLYFNYQADDRYDNGITLEDNAATLNVSPEAVGENVLLNAGKSVTALLTDEEKALLANREIVEVKVDGKSIDLNNLNSIPIKIHCDPALPCDYQVHGEIRYSIGPKEPLTWTFRYRPPGQQTTATQPATAAPTSQGASCPNWQGRLENHCTGCRSGDVYELDACDSQNKRLLQNGASIPSCDQLCKDLTTGQSEEQSYEPCPYNEEPHSCPNGGIRRCTGITINGSCQYDQTQRVNPNCQEECNPAPEAPVDTGPNPSEVCHEEAADLGEGCSEVFKVCEDGSRTSQRRERIGSGGDCGILSGEEHNGDGHGGCCSDDSGCDEDQTCSGDNGACQSGKICE